MEQEKERSKEGRGVQERRKISSCIRLSAFLRETLYSLSQITPGENKSLGFIPIAVKNALTKKQQGTGKGLFSLWFQVTAHFLGAGDRLVTEYPESRAKRINTPFLA